MLLNARRSWEALLLTEYGVFQSISPAETFYLHFLSHEEKKVFSSWFIHFIWSTSFFFLCVFERLETCAHWANPTSVSNDLFTRHGNRTRTGTGNQTSTIGNNGSWFLSLPWTSVNISVQHISTHCSRSSVNKPLTREFLQAFAFVYQCECTKMDSTVEANITFVCLFRIYIRITWTSLEETPRRTYRKNLCWRYRLRINWNSHNVNEP